MNQQELIAEIESYAEDLLDDQRQKHEWWLEEQKAEEAQRLAAIAHQVQVCATLLESLLDHMRNRHSRRKLIARKRCSTSAVKGGEHGKI